MPNGRTRLGANLVLHSQKRYHGTDARLGDI